MQTYRFKTKQGVEMKLELSDCEFRRRVKNNKLRIKGRLSGKSTVYELVGVVGGNTLGTHGACWPMKSDCVGIEPEQIPQAMAEDARVGAPSISYDPNTGEAIFDSALQRKRWSEAHGFYVVTKRGSSSSRDPVRYSQREIEARAMAGRSVRHCDD